MPSDTAYSPDPRFAALGPDFSDRVRPARFPAHILRWRNARWTDAVGLSHLDADSFERAFALFLPLPGNQPEPLAMRYHGHQFRTYNPDLGDGRGFLYAQLRDGAGRLLDLATKGSGQTPYSRSADGRLTLKGAVREILAAHMLEALGVNTSKAFAVFETGEALKRHDEPSPTRSAVLTRLGHSHIRIGTFQRLAYLGQTDAMERLVAHCADVYYPALAPLEREAQAVGLLQAASAANARLAGQWMAAGFVHGVLNSDNMNVTGESFDYGPWRFLPTCEPEFTAAYFDETGLYAFARQPHAVAWNVSQLASALQLVAPREALEPALAGFAPAYQAGLRDAVFARLGMTTGRLEDDLPLVAALFDWMTAAKPSFEQVFFDWFCGDAQRAARSPQAAMYEDAAFAPVRAALTTRSIERPGRLTHPYFARATPATLLIDEVEALWAPIAESDDWRAFDAKIADIDEARRGYDLGASGGAPHGPKAS